MALIGTPVLLGGAALVAWVALLAAQGFAAYLLGSWIVHTFRLRATVAPVAQC